MGRCLKNAAILWRNTRFRSTCMPCAQDKCLVIRGCFLLLGQKVKLRLGRASTWRGDTTVPLIRPQPTYKHARNLAHSTQVCNQHSLTVLLAMCNSHFSPFVNPEDSVFGPPTVEQEPNTYSIESFITPYDQYPDRAETIDPAVFFSTYDATAYRRTLIIDNQPLEPCFKSTDE